jgi:hypothetical protein
MAQKGQFSADDIVDVQPSAVKPKGTFSVADIMDKPITSPTKAKIEDIQSKVQGNGNILNTISPDKVPDTMTPESARWLQHPVTAFKEGATSALGLDPNNIIKSGIGIDPEHPWSGTTMDSLTNSALGKQIKSGLTSLPGYPIAPRGLNDVNPIEGVSNLVSAAAAPAEEGADAIRERDPGKFMHALGGIVAVTAPSVKAGIEAGSALKTGLATKPQPQFDPNKPGVKLPEAPKPAQDMAKLHGGETSYELKDKIENEVYPQIKDDLKQSEKDLLNRPAKTAQEHFAILKDSAQRIWNEYKTYLDQGSTIDGNDVVNRAVGSYDKSVAANHPDEFNNFKDKVEAAFKDQKLSPEQAQQRLTQLNAEANGFYAANNASDMAAKGKLAGAQKYLATGDALRSVLDEHLPEGASNVRQRYGGIAELMSGMPMPSEAGKGFFPAMFDESAKAMSTRPGFAMMRGGLRALKAGGADKLVKSMYGGIEYTGNPTTSPTTTITNPLTGEKQTVPVGPKGSTTPTYNAQGPNANGHLFTDEGLRKTFNIPNDISLKVLSDKGLMERGQGGMWEVKDSQGINNVVNPQPTAGASTHPMSPRQVLQGEHPLELNHNPLEVSGTNPLNNQPPRGLGGLVTVPSIMEPPVSIHPPVAGTDLPNVAPTQRPPLANAPPPQPPIASSAPHSQVPTGLNTTGITTGTSMLPGQELQPTPLSHALSPTGYSQIEGLPPTRTVPQWQGMEPSNPLYGNGQAAPLGGSKAEATYQPPHVQAPAQVPVRSAIGGQFQNGFPSGEQIMPPAPETLKKLGGKVKINTGLKVKGK